MGVDVVQRKEKGWNIMKQRPPRKRSSWILLSRKLFHGPVSSDLSAGEKVLSQLRAIRQELNLNSSNIRKTAFLPVFHPESLLRLCWDLIIITSVLYQSFTVPLFLTFSFSSPPALHTLETISTVVFLIDIRMLYLAVNCNTGFYAKGSLITTRRTVLKHYVTGWLWADVVASFPYAWVADDVYTQENTASASNGYFLLLRLFRFLRILRLLRLMKVRLLLIKLEEYVAWDWLTDWFEMGKLLFFLCLFAHWVACWWFYIGSLESTTQESSWTVTFQSSGEAYVTALYFAFTTMTTVGYGDVVPVTTNERVFVTCTMVLCCGLQAYIIGSIGSLVSKRNSAAAEYRESVVALNQYMKKHELPTELQFRVRRFLEYLWSQKNRTQLSEKEVLDQLSEPLRNEVYAQVNGAVVYLCPVMREFEPSFVTRIGKLLKSESFAPDDIIFEVGNLGGKIYFIFKGAIDIFHAQTMNSFAILKEKEYFGEIAFFLGVSRCASSRCVEFAELLSLDRFEVEPVLTQHPESRECFRVLSLRVQSAGNLSPLLVRCYVCNSLGHVAAQCRRSVVDYNHEETKEKWLRQRFSHTVFISREVPPIPNHVRKERKSRNSISAKNVLGIPRTPESLYPDDPHLLPRITEYMETYEREKDKHITTTAGQITDSTPNTNALSKKPTPSFIYRDSSDGIEDSTFLEDSLDGSKPQFGRSLTRYSGADSPPWLRVPLASQKTELARKKPLFAACARLTQVLPASDDNEGSPSKGPEPP